MRAILQLIVCIVLFFPIIICYGQDETNTAIYPNIYVCKLTMKIGSATYSGTGVIINDNTILTNAHNVFEKDSIIAYPGQYRSNERPYGIIKVKCEKNKNVFYPSGFDNEDNTLDFAVIKFNNPEVINNLKKISNENYPILEYRENISELNITGYPVHRWFEFKSDNGKIQYHNSTTIFNITNNNLINYKLNTRGGSSGSPLWVKVGNKCYIIGIHKSGKIKKNQGIFYDQSRINLILSWVKEQS